MSNKMTLTDVKICGIKSTNKREYPIHVLEKAIPLYEGQSVYLNHDISGKNRKYEDRVGFVKGVHAKQDGLYAKEMTLNPYHTFAEQLWWDWSQNTKSVGVSHEVICKDVAGVVSEIKEVRSIDIVANPGSVKSFREEKENEEVLKDTRIDSLEKTLLECLNKLEVLEKDNIKLVSEVKELKQVKPIQKEVLPQPPAKPETNIKEWASKFKGRK